MKDNCTDWNRVIGRSKHKKITAKKGVTVVEEQERRREMDKESALNFKTIIPQSLTTTL